MPWLSSSSKTSESAAFRGGPPGTDFPSKYRVAIDGVVPFLLSTDGAHFGTGILRYSGLWNC
jgi:hypothetical protein